MTDVRRALLTPLLIGEVEVPGRGIVTIAAAYPCADGSGSGSGGTGCCPDTTKSLRFTVIATTGDCDCAMGTSVDLPYDAVEGGWVEGGLDTYEPCGYPIELQVMCSGDGVFTFTGTGANQTFRVLSCSPFVAIATSDMVTVPPGLNCTGTITWEVTEV